jgi:erythronate-4-phosphate dehydrogenase
MIIVADQNIPGLENTFGRHGEIRMVDGRSLKNEHLQNARVLIVRSVTSVNQELLTGTPVEFVGTATIGTDHLDTSWLDLEGLRWVSAPGCNADAAAQYTLSMMMLACKRIGKQLQSMRCAVIGRGNVGSRVQSLLQTLDVEVIVIDPPLADTGQEGFASMEDITRCDLVSLHVPLTREGRYPTFHLVNEQLLGQLRPGTLMINTSRGDVTDGPALSSWLQAGNGYAALDVWPGEPALNEDLLRSTIVATPHVAGYSQDGKMHGTLQIYAAFLDCFESGGMDSAVALENHLNNLLPPRGVHLLENVASVSEAVMSCCGVRDDDANTRELIELDPEHRPAAFDSLRRGYPSRRDFAGWRLPATLGSIQLRILEQLGFTRS